MSSQSVKKLSHPEYRLSSAAVNLERKLDRDNSPSSPPTNSCFENILAQRIRRRQFLQTLAAGSTAAGLGIAACSTTKIEASGLGFRELSQGLDETLHVAEDHQAHVLLRWGDPLFADAPAFDPHNQTVQSQIRQFGFNNDYTGFLPLPTSLGQAERGLLVVNHEYTNSDLMFPGSPSEQDLTLDQVDVDIAAHGLSLVEIAKTGADAQWRVVLDSPFNRRITPHTPMRFSGPAAGSKRLRSASSADGVNTLGTYGNCAGGLTPWGTVLSGEENIQDYFSGDFSQADLAQKENYQRFGLQADTSWAAWPRFYDRWNMSVNPNEPMNVGWIVEIDPLDPLSTPVKHTALGRFKHEGCNVHINPDGRIVAYTGDDQVFEYLYRFVSDGVFDPDNRQANMQLLDKGVLSVARFDETGLNWIPLVFGEGPLTEGNGFYSQADVCLDTRKAADLMGATRMDRPEDIEVNPVTLSVFVMLTKNTNRTHEEIDGVNPRSKNRGGQIIELIAPRGDHAADRFGWEIFVLAGDPEQVATHYHPATSENGWFACPDNCAFDRRGNLWIATDGADDFGIADGIWVAAVRGAERALPKHFLRAPRGAEVCGPSFTPDNTSFFCAIQHPGADGGTFDVPSTRWPDFQPDLPPRPSVVVVSKNDGGPVGSERTVVF